MRASEPQNRSKRSKIQDTEQINSTNNVKNPPAAATIAGPIKDISIDASGRSHANTNHKRPKSPNQRLIMAMKAEVTLHSEGVTINSMMDPPEDLIPGEIFATQSIFPDYDVSYHDRKCSNSTTRTTSNLSIATLFLKMQPSSHLCGNSAVKGTLTRVKSRNTRLESMLMAAA